MIIMKRIGHRLREGVWDRSQGLTRQAQGNWLRALKKNIKLYLGMDFIGALLGPPAGKQKGTGYFLNEKKQENDRGVTH